MNSLNLDRKSLFQEYGFDTNEKYHRIDLFFLISLLP